MKIIRVNEDKKVKWRYKLKNKLIIFTYHLKLVYYFILYHYVILSNIFNLFNNFKR